ncbi:hypothetical protein PRUPE_7G125500 [Prunus persica]|uniref:Uncharacterized protein n=1 Tax=Prunus persica TaxID=3760 RepID=A0A251NCQ3_PRUPE|nr:hypothetical protein PRUPE_7G125500 [Prunus persica]
MILWPSLSSSNTNSFFVGTMTFGEQNTFPESFGLLDQAFLSCINFFSWTLQKCIQWFSEPRLRVRGGVRSVILATKVLSGKMTWIQDGPRFLNDKNITEAIDGRFAKANSANSL